MKKLIHFIPPFIFFIIFIWMAIISPDFTFWGHPVMVFSGLFYMQFMNRAMFKIGLWKRVPLEEWVKSQRDL